MNIYEYDVVNAIIKDKYTNQRMIAESTGYSLGKTNESVHRLIEKGYLNHKLSPTEKTYQEINHKKPKNAIILAAGFGMRMVPINTEVPKGLLEVKEESLIERLISQLHEVGVFNIDIVVGFLKERYEYLIDKYGVNLVYNRSYANKNNIHSLNLLVDKISNTYILPCDIWAERNPFSKHELYSWYAVSNTFEEESTIRINRQRELVSIPEEEPGNTMIGVSYLIEEQAHSLRKKIKAYCNKSKYTDSFWEEALFNDEQKETIYARVYQSEEVFEIDTYEQLRDLDKNSSHLETEIISLIAKEMNVEPKDIQEIVILKKGMTNRSFRFSVKDKQYIMRVPGEGTDELINRKNEYKVYKTIKKSRISDDIIYISGETGYKITKYLGNARECDPFNQEDVKLCMQKLRDFHNQKMKVPHKFHLYETLEFYEKLWEGNSSVFKDYLETKAKMFELKSIIEASPKELVLSHIDSVPDNFLIVDDEVRLIDWEYSGMQDPHLDIAMFAIYSLYDREEIDDLINIYFQGSCEFAVKIKIYCYIAVCGLLWSNWCEYKRLCGVEFGEYSLRQYRYAKDFYKVVKEEISKVGENQ